MRRGAAELRFLPQDLQRGRTGHEHSVHLGISKRLSTWRLDMLLGIQGEPSTSHDFV